MALGMTVARVKSEMTECEFQAWIVYDRLHPFGDDRADMRQALTSCILAESNSKATQHFKINDFMIGQGHQRQTAEEMKEFLMGWAKRHGKKRKKKKG